MSSSFLILHPDIQKSAMTYTVSAAFQEDYPIFSSFYGTGYLHSRIETAASSFTVTFDLGTGNTRTLDYLVIGGVKSLIAANVSQVKVEGSNDNSTWINQLGTASSFTSKTFDGPYDDDIIFTTTKNSDIVGTLAAYRYFRVTMAVASGTAAFAFRKLYLGQAFDMGLEPASYNLEVAIENETDTWKYPRGHTILSKSFYPKHKITVEWDGVSDSKANEFSNLLLDDPNKNSVYLYTKTHTDPLYDNVLMHCRIVSGSTTITKANDVDDWNDIVAVFEEV